MCASSLFYRNLRKLDRCRLRCRMVFLVSRGVAGIDVATAAPPVAKIGTALSALRRKILVLSDFRKVFFNFDNRTSFVLLLFAESTEILRISII